MITGIVGEARYIQQTAEHEKKATPESRLFYKLGTNCFSATLTTGNLNTDQCPLQGEIGRASCRERV